MIFVQGPIYFTFELEKEYLKNVMTIWDLKYVLSEMMWNQFICTWKQTSGKASISQPDTTGNITILQSPHRAIQYEGSRIINVLLVKFMAYTICSPIIIIRLAQNPFSIHIFNSFSFKNNYVSSILSIAMQFIFNYLLLHLLNWQFSRTFQSVK